MNNQTAFHQFISLFPNAVADEVHSALTKLRAQNVELPSLDHPIFETIREAFSKHLDQFTPVPAAKPAETPTPVKTQSVEESTAQLRQVAESLARFLPRLDTLLSQEQTTASFKIAPRPGLSWIRVGGLALVISGIFSGWIHSALQLQAERKLQDVIATVKSHQPANDLTLQQLARAQVSVSVTPDAGSNRYFLRLNGVREDIKAAPAPNGVTVIFQTR